MNNRTGFVLFPKINPVGKGEREDLRYKTPGLEFETPGGPWS